MWGTVTQATDYLVSTRLDSTSWTSLSDPDKTKLLTNSFLRISENPDFSFPETVENNMIYAQAELAFQSLSDEETQIPGNVASFGLGSFSMSFDGGKTNKLYAAFGQRVGELLVNYFVKPTLRKTLFRNKYRG